MRVQRLRGSKQFSQVFAQGRRFAVGQVVVIVRRAPGPVRWGIVVGKRVGNAVARNRVKRRLRDICRVADGMMRSGADVVVVAQPSAAAADYHTLLRAVVAALGRAKLVSAAGIAGRRVRGEALPTRPKAGPR